MVRSARFAFDDPRGPDRQSINDPFDEGDDPLFEAPLSAGDELPRPSERRESGSRPDKHDDRITRPDRAA